MADKRYDLGIGAASRHTGFSAASIRKWADAGDLRAMRTPAPGLRWRFSQEDLDEFVSSRLNVPTREAV